MIVLDSSFLISFYLTEDLNHEEALRLIKQNKEETMLLPDLILEETLTVLNYKRGLWLAREAFNELTTNKQIRYFHFTEIERDEIVQLFFKQKVKLSVADSSVVYLAKKSNSKVLSFDKTILNESGNRESSKN